MKTQIWISRKDKIYRWLPEKEAAVYEKQQKHDDGTRHKAITGQLDYYLVFVICYVSLKL